MREEMSGMFCIVKIMSKFTINMLAAKGQIPYFHQGQRTSSCFVNISKVSNKILTSQD